MSYANMDGVPTQTAGTSELLASDWNTYVRDNFDSIKFGHVVCTSSTRPTGIAEGTMIYETDTNKALIYNGSSWVEVNDLDSSYGLNAGFYSSIKNVVMGTDSTATVIASTTPTATGLSVSITPSSSSNKVLVYASVSAQSFRAVDANNAGYYLYRNGSALTSGIGSMIGTTGATTAGFTAVRAGYSICYLDSPATTSATTYAIYARVSTTANSATTTAQYDNEPSQIIAMEVVV